MDEDQLYVTTPPHKPPRRVPADTISVEWLTERLEQLPTRKEMYRAVSRVDLPLAARPYRRSVPLTTMSTSRLPHAEHTSRSRQLGTAVSAPYRRSRSAGSGSTQCWHVLHQTMRRTPALAAFPSVIGGPV
jgi:hypothetical protein